MCFSHRGWKKAIQNDCLTVGHCSTHTTIANYLMDPVSLGSFNATNVKFFMKSAPPDVEHHHDEVLLLILL